MKTEIIVKKEYPFCPKKVGEKLEEKGNTYCIMQLFEKNTSLYSNIYDLSLTTQRFFNSELLRAIAEYLNEGWQPDFYNIDQPKYSLYYSFKEKKYSIAKSMVIFDLNVVYFKSEVIAQQAIELMGEKRLNTLR